MDTLNKLMMLSKRFMNEDRPSKVLKKRNRKSNKVENWFRWAATKLTRRGIPTPTSSCAYRRTHWVKSVHKIGGGFYFYSGGCSGCHPHLFKTERMPADNCCALLDYPILSKKEPTVGEAFTV